YPFEARDRKGSSCRDGSIGGSEDGRQTAAAILPATARESQARFARLFRPGERTGAQGPRIGGPNACLPEDPHRDEEPELRYSGSESAADEVAGSAIAAGSFVPDGSPEAWPERRRRSPRRGDINGGHH